MYAWAVLKAFVISAAVVAALVALAEFLDRMPYR